MKKRIGKKTGFIVVLFWLLAMNTVFADYTITYEVRVTKTVNAPKQNEDGTWDTADPNKKIRLDDGENPNDPKNYEGKGGIPTSTTSDTQTRIITIEGNNPPSDIEVQKQIEADIEKIAGAITGANENSGATNNNKTTGLVTVNGTVTIQNNINKEVVREQKVSASAPIGDPVLLSSGQYLYTETDIDLLVSGLSFPITRYYQSGKNISATSMWFMSTDSRVVRGQKFQPEKELATLNALYTDSVANYNDTNKKYRDLKKWYTDQIALCKKELSVLKKGRSEINVLLGRNLTASSRTKIENYIKKYDANISYYTNLQNDCERELDKDKKNDPTGALVKIRAEIAKQEVLLNEQKALLVQSEKELAHHNANVSYNSYAIRGSGFTDLIACGNDILKVYDERGVAFSYRIKEAPVYGAGQNHYPGGSETEALFPGDENNLRLLKDGSFEWQKKDGSIWFYSAQGLLSRVQNANGVGIDFVYSPSYYLSSINYEGEVLYRFRYEGAKLERIENARDPSEFVAYGYTENLLSSVRDTDGDTVSFAYEGTLLKKIIKPDSSFVSFTYAEVDSRGEKLTTKTTNEEGFSEQFVYDKKNKLTTYIDHSGKKSLHYFNTAHQEIKEVLSDGTTINYAYDARGNLVSENRNGRVTTYAYDARGNKTQTKYADGSTEEWQYNALDKPLLYKDRDGVSLGYSYDEKGNLLSLSRGGKEIFSAVYNEKGLILSSVQASVNYAYSYDTYGNVIQRKTGTGMQQRLEVWTYDAQNRVTSYINPLGEKTEYQYPTKSSTKILYPNGLETEIVYNNRKDLVKLIQKDTTTGKIITKEFLYDKRHKLLEQRVNGVKTVSFSYKPAGEIESEIYWDAEGGWKKHYVYDEAARVKEVVQSKLDSNGAQVGAESYATKFSYARNLAEEIITMTDPLNRALSQTRDEWNRVTKTKNALNEELTQSFSPQGRIKESQISFGGKFSYDYDAQGYLTTMKEAEGEGEVRYTYNPDGSIKTQTDSKGNLTSFFYNDFGELSEKQSAGKKEFFSYDSLGRLSLYIVGNNKNKMTAESWTEYAYANNGKTVKINYGGLVFQEQTRDAFGNTISVKDGMENETKYFYNNLGQLICEENAYGNRTYYRYNALGKITHVWYPDVLVNAGGSASEEANLVALKLDTLKASLVYTYNFLGRVEKISDALGTSWEGSYDKGGRLISEKGRNLSETEYTYDALDRITEVRLAGLVSEQYSYTNRGRNITFADGNGNSYSYNKDLYGKLTSEKNRLGDVQSYVYEKDGSLKNTKDFLSKIKTITMDEKNRKQTISYADGSKDIISYTMTGLIASAETSTGLIRYSYNQAGLLIKQEDVKAGEQTNYVYDKAGRRVLMDSNNREVLYSYGKMGEVLSVFDNKQRLRVNYAYDSLLRETERTFGNGVVQKTFYDAIGRIEVISEVNARGDILRSEGYVYDENGRRLFTLDEKGRFTRYAYDAQGRVSQVLYPYTESIVNAARKEAEEEGVFYIEENIKGVNYFLTTSEKTSLTKLLEKMSWGRSAYLTTTNVQWEETFTYDANGNRATKTTSFGSIRYWYDKENRLVHSGSDAGRGTDYIYDKNGNLIEKNNLYKTDFYSYTGSNRMKSSVIEDHREKTKTITRYDYDALGRRTLVQDEGSTLMRTLYDGMSFDIIREQESFADGYFTNTSDTYVDWQASGGESASRYRYIGEEADSSNGNSGNGENQANSQSLIPSNFYANRGEIQTGSSGDYPSNFHANSNADYRLVSPNRSRSSVTLFAKGEAVATNKNSYSTSTTSTSTGNRSGTTSASTKRSYFGTDMIGSVRSSTHDDGLNANYYDYDVFGKPFGETSDYGYVGKPYDPVTGLSNYGYRDYSPKTARFTTVDPIRDGHNWYAYCSNDPVNFVDLWGLSAGDVKYQSFNPADDWALLNESLNVYLNESWILSDEIRDMELKVQKINGEIINEQINNLKEQIMEYVTLVDLFYQPINDGYNAFINSGGNLGASIVGFVGGVNAQNLSEYIYDQTQPKADNNNVNSLINKKKILKQEIKGSKTLLKSYEKEINKLKDKMNATTK